MLVIGCAYHWVIGLGLLGLDTYPMILTSRIESGDEVLLTFTQELMDGRYTDGRFYRPVANLAFALDYALWKLEPKGYHLTDLIILTVNALLLGALAARLLGRGFRIAPLVAALVFVLHPAQLEILPVSARRADTLSLLFTLACLLAQPGSSKTGLRPRAGVLSAVLALLAICSKETGIVVVPLVFVWHALATSDASVRRRLLHALVWTIPPIFAACTSVVARTFVLGGLGGHGISVIEAVGSLHRLIEPYLALLLLPWLPRAPSVCVAALALCLFSLVALLLKRSERSEPHSDSRLRRAFGFLSLWMLSLLCVSSISGRVEAWYAMVFVPAYAILLGVLVDRGFHAAAQRRFVIAIPTLTISLAVCAVTVYYSALLHDYPRWQSASQLAYSFLERFDARVRGTPPGSMIEMDRFAQAVAPSTTSAGIRSAVILTDYSVQAWAELAMPDRPVEVFLMGSPATPTGPIGERIVRVRLIAGVRPTKRGG